MSTMYYSFTKYVWHLCTMVYYGRLANKFNTIKGAALLSTSKYYLYDKNAYALFSRTKLNCGKFIRVSCVPTPRIRDMYYNNWIGYRISGC